MPGADALGTPAPAATPTVGVVSDEDHRLAMAGMVAPQTSDLAVRTGVMWGPGTTALVTGTAATGTMTYSIAIHHAVTTRGTADGVYLGPTLDAPTTVPTTAAPGSNSRIDIIYVKQNDTSSTVSADAGSTAPIYAVANGTAAVSPVAPTLPVGAIELGRATVAVGATSTNGAGVTITQTAVQTVARGVDIPVRNQAERDALTTYPMLTVKRLDTGAIERRNVGDTAWVTIYDPTITSQWVTLFTSDTTYLYSPTPANTWVNLPGFSGFTTPVIPTGRDLEVEMTGPMCNAGSGFLYVRLLVGGTQREASGFSACWAPLRLLTAVPGAGATFSVAVQAQSTTLDADVRAASGQAVRLRYRIV